MSSGEELVTTDDGVCLWTARSGTGPPMVLCHGGPGLWDWMEPVAEMVGDIVTVHRWDQRGCGRSSGSGPYTISRFVTDMESLREHFGYESWVVGGHSWGATLALHYAFTHPERVRALVYISGTGLGYDWKSAYEAEVERRLTREQIQRLGELNSRPRSEAEEVEYRVLRWAPDFADRGRAPDLALREAEAPFQINPECNAALNAEDKSWREEDLISRCRRLSMPALVVHGYEDPRPVWATASLVEALDGAELRVLDGIGHVPWVEDPEGFRSVLRGFLSRTIGRQALER